jgi:hypothetical protein
MYKRAAVLALVPHSPRPARPSSPSRLLRVRSHTLPRITMKFFATAAAALVALSGFAGLVAG